MATLQGSGGVLQAGGNTVAEIRTFSIDETQDTIETTSMGDSNRSFVAGLGSFSGSADVFFDDTDTTGQGALTVGASLSLDVGVEGNSTGDHRLTGNIIVTGRTISASFDGMIEATISFTGTGGLTETTFA